MPAVLRTSTSCTLKPDVLLNHFIYELQSFVVICCSGDTGFVDKLFFHAPWTHVSMVWFVAHDTPLVPLHLLTLVVVVIVFKLLLSIIYSGSSNLDSDRLIIPFKFHFM